MIIHYEWFNGTEQSIWLYFVNKTDKTIKNITWVVRVNGTDDQLELVCDDGYEDNGRIHRYFFNTQYSDLGYGGVHVDEVTVTYEDGTVETNPELKEESNLRMQVAEAERRKVPAYYTEPVTFSFGSKPKAEPGTAEALKEEKSKYIKYGIIGLIVFFPVGIYFLYKASQVGK